MADSKKFDLLNIWRDKRSVSESVPLASTAPSPNSSFRNYADVLVPSAEKKEQAALVVSLHAAQGAVEQIERLTGGSAISCDALLELWQRVVVHETDAWEDLRVTVFKFIQACVRFQQRPLGQELSAMAILRPVFFDLLFRHHGDELHVTRTLGKLVEHSALLFERLLPTLVGRLMRCESSSKEATALAQELIKKGSFGTYEETGISLCCAAASMPLLEPSPAYAFQEPLERHFLDLIKSAQQYRFLPPRVLPLVVTRLCCSVHTELLWEPVTELMRSMLLRRGNLNVVNCLLQVLENPVEYAAACDADWQQISCFCSVTPTTHTTQSSTCLLCANLRSIDHRILFSSVTVIRGCVFFLTMFTWGPRKLPDLKLPCAVVLPAFASALPGPNTSFEKMAVVTEIVLSIKRLVTKYGTELYFEWEHIFRIIHKVSMTLPWKFEGAPFDAFIDTIKYMLRLNEDGTLLFTDDSLFDEIENFLAHVPQDIQVKCLSHRTNRAHPSFPDWQVQLQRFCDVYLLSVPQYHVKGIALDAIRQFIDLFGSSYPDDITSAVVPSLLDLACGSTPAHVFDAAGIANLHQEAVQCLLDLATLSKDIRNFAQVVSHIEAVATRKGSFLRYELTLDSVRRAESVCDTLTDTEIFAMQGALGVFHAVFTDDNPARLLYLWDMFKKWINHGWGPIRLFTLAACQMISVSDDGRPRFSSSCNVTPSTVVRNTETDSDYLGVVESFTTRLSPWSVALPEAEHSSHKDFDVQWLYDACIKCMNIYATQSDRFSQQMTTSAVQALIVGFSSSLIFDFCNVVPVAVSLCRWLLPQPGLEPFDAFSQCPPFFASKLCRNLSVATEDGMQVEFEFLMYDLLSAVAMRMATCVNSGKAASLPSSDMNAVFQSCCSALIYGAGCGCRSIPDAVWSLTISVSHYTHSLSTDDLHLASDMQGDNSLSSISTGASVAATCNFAILLASSPNLVVAFWPHFLSVMRLYLSSVLGVPKFNGSVSYSRVQISPAPDCILSISLVRQILNVIRVAIRVIPHVCAHHLDIPFILGLTMNDVRVGTVVSHFSHSLMVEWYNCCVSLSQKDPDYAASGQVQAALGEALAAVQPFTSRDNGGVDVPISAATLEALVCGSLGTMKPAVHDQAQFYFVIGEAIWTAVPLPDGGIFVVIRRGAGCFSWTVSPTVAVPRSLPFALLQEKSDQFSLSQPSGSPNVSTLGTKTVLPVSNISQTISGSDFGQSIPQAPVTFSALLADPASAFSLADVGLDPEVLQSLSSSSLKPINSVTHQFLPAMRHSLNVTNPSSPIIRPLPISPLISAQSSAAVTVGRGRTKFNSSPSIQPLAFSKMSPAASDQTLPKKWTPPLSSSPFPNDGFFDPIGSKGALAEIPIISVGDPIISPPTATEESSSSSAFLPASDGLSSEVGGSPPSSLVVNALCGSVVSSVQDNEQFLLSQGNEPFVIHSQQNESFRFSAGSSLGANISNPFSAHADADHSLGVRGESGNTPDSPQTSTLRFSYDQQSLIKSPLKRQVMNDDQTRESELPILSLQQPIPSGSQEAEAAHSNSSAEGGAEVVQQPTFGNHAYSARSDRSSSIHSISGPLPSYDDDVAGLDLIGANITGVLEEAPASTGDSQMPRSGSFSYIDSGILDAIPRSPRSILTSEGGQQGGGGADRSLGTSWWRPSDTWRKKHFARLGTQLGAPLPIGPFAPSKSGAAQEEPAKIAHSAHLSAAALDRRHSLPASAASSSQSPMSEKNKTPNVRDSSSCSPLKQSPSPFRTHDSPNSPKSSPSKSQSGNVDNGMVSSSVAEKDLHSGSPSGAAFNSSNAAVAHLTKDLGCFVDNQAPLIIDESASLSQEASEAKTADMNGSKAAKWLHVIMQLIPPPISGSGSVETLSAAESSTLSAMNILDKTPPCDFIRAALIFCGSDGSSAAPSSRFMQVVRGLGQLVPLSSASARDIFTGGLDTTGLRHGSWALHCSSAAAQTVFYVPALMHLERGCAPDASTKQSIDGLVGNCYVTIVYTENEFEVTGRSHLLVGDFHWLVITVQPISGGRNRVVGRMKSGHPQLSVFGPAAKIVSDESLPALLQVRSFEHTCTYFIHTFSVRRHDCRDRLPHHV